MANVFAIQGSGVQTADATSEGEFGPRAYLVGELAMEFVADRQSLSSQASTRRPAGRSLSGEEGQQDFAFFSK